LQTTRISWEQDAEYRLPAQVWRETMDHHFPGTAWLRLHKGALDRLLASKARNALATWDDAIDALRPEGERACLRSGRSRPRRAGWSGPTSAWPAASATSPGTRRWSVRWPGRPRSRSLPGAHGRTWRAGRSCARGRASRAPWTSTWRRWPRACTG